MEKEKYYYWCKFKTKVIKEVYNKFLSLLDKDKNFSSIMSITRWDESRNYNTFDEFLNEYALSTSCHFYHSTVNKELGIYGNNTTFRIKIKSNQKEEIESIFQIFESNIDESIIKIEKEPIKIFIWHWQDNQWRDLKDHLHEKHWYEIIAYEIWPRAWLSVKDVLNNMLNESSFALLLLTWEDEDNEWNLHARENVIHELWLFQWKIGFERAIAVLERWVNEFSNILGINQIRFNKGNIKETYWDILATIKREFETEK